MNQEEYKSRQFFKCVHGHNGHRHPNCYDQHNDLKIKIGFFDIETSNLKADFGIILCYRILSEDGEMLRYTLSPEEIKSGVFDKNLVESFCKDARKFDRIVGYYSSKFDAPFIRTRAVHYNIDFPLYGEVKHTDAYLIVKHKLNLHSRRLGVVAPFFNIPAKDHPLNPTVWIKCLGGDKKSLDFVGVHCDEDVESLRQLWGKINKYARITNTSI